MRGDSIDIFTHTLNRMLIWPDYDASIAIPELEHHLTLASSQRPWLSRLLSDDGNPS